MVKKYKVSKNVSEEPSLIIYDQIMLTPGIWNGVKFTKDQIEFGINNTDWTNPENFALINYHPKNGEIPSSTSWQGYFENISYKTLEHGVDKEGMYGDLYIYDPILASKLLSKKSPLAVSIDASYSRSNYGAQKLSFTHTALIYRPGCSDAYIQLEANGDNHKMRIVCEENVSIKESKDDIKSIKLSFDLETDKIVQVYNKENELLFEGSVLSFSKLNEETVVSIMNELDDIKEFVVNDFLFFPIMPRMVIPIEDTDIKENDIELAKVTAMETKRKELGMSVSEFYAAPRDPPSESKLPIFDESHTRNAMSRFNQTDFKNNEEKKKAKSKIISVAKKFNIEVKEFAKLEIIQEEIIDSKEEVKLVNIYTVKKEDKKLKMNSNNIESLEARISLIEKRFEQLDVKLSEKSEEVEPKEEVISKEVEESVSSESEDVKEENKIESSESKDEVVSEEPKVEKQEVVKEVVESKEEVIQVESIKQLKSEISELKAKLAKKDEIKEVVKLESEDKKKTAQSKTAVQLESSDELKVEKKVQLSKTESILARLNKDTRCTKDFSNKE